MRGDGGTLTGAPSASPARHSTGALTIGAACASATAPSDPGIDDRRGVLGEAAVLGGNGRVATPRPLLQLQRED